VSAQDAKEAADDFVAKRRLQPAAKGDKRKFQLVTFVTEEDCRFFYPRGSLGWQQKFNTYISRALRERYGIRVQRIALSQGDYEDWCRRNAAGLFGDGAPPKMPSPREFADSHLRLIDPK
jgi:hypothetical protein